MRFAVLCLATLVGCSPDLEDGKFSCVRADDECPEGYTCELDQRCHAEPLSPCRRCGDVDQSGKIDEADSDVLDLVVNGFTPTCSQKSANVDGKGGFDNRDRALLNWMVVSRSNDNFPQCDTFTQIADGPPKLCTECTRIAGDVNDDGVVNILDWDALMAYPCAIASAEDAPPFCGSNDPCLIRELDQRPDGQLTTLDADQWRIEHCPKACDIPTDQPLVVCQAYDMLRACLVGTCRELASPP